MVATLNWGLGHSSRSIPVVKALLTNGYTPILASDGDALELLKKEFPTLQTIELPSYKIKYTKKRNMFWWQMVLNIPRIMQAIRKEEKQTKKIIEQYQIKGIISDNRFGVVSSDLPSVIITHQVKVLSGFTTFFTSKINHYFINKFVECWVPDVRKKENLTGELSKLYKSNLKIKYIGVLSRFEKKDIPNEFDLAVVLSGPEPQRTIFEKIISRELKQFNGKVVFVKGKVENKISTETVGHITHYNYLTSKELEKVLNASKVVLARSGYSTIMDLAKLEKKAFFVPTPAQPEQEYLGKRLEMLGVVPFASQDSFKIEMLDKIPSYSGFKSYNQKNDWNDLFQIFEK